MFGSTDDVLDGVHLLRAYGEIDLDAVSAVRDAIARLLERRGPHVIDLSGVTFLDSTGLKLLDEARQIATENGERVEIVCPPGRVLRLLEITGVDDLLGVHATLDAAVEASRG